MEKLDLSNRRSKEKRVKLAGREGKLFPKKRRKQKINGVVSKSHRIGKTCEKREKHKKVTKGRWFGAEYGGRPVREVAETRKEMIISQNRPMTGKKGIPAKQKVRDSIGKKGDHCERKRAGERKGKRFRPMVNPPRGGKKWWNAKTEMW